MFIQKSTDIFRIYDCLLVHRVNVGNLSSKIWNDLYLAKRFLILICDSRNIYPFAFG